MLEAVKGAIEQLNGVVWGWPMIILLLGTHIFMTFRTGVIQKYLFRGIKLSVAKDPDSEGDVSQFGALATALASTIGTGNIIGVGTAVVMGGPGAVFWCWLTGVFGISTKYAESLLSVKYRVKTEDGRMQGGPMYVLEYGFKNKKAGKFLALMFAAFGSVATIGTGCATQVNAIAVVCKENFQAPAWIIGVILAILVGIVIFGGIQTISKVCEKLVPLMAAFYVLGCICILVMNYDFIIPALQVIVKLAFQPGAALGGLVGSGIMMAMRYGIARGLFSNESGMGTAPIAAAAAKTRNPVRQALVSSTGTFWDTVVVCMMTGLVLVTTIMKNSTVDVTHIEDGGILTTLAFRQIPILGPLILVVGILSFAFSTIIGWFYYGERCVEYLGGKKAMMVYRIFYVGVALIAPVISLNFMWVVTDTLNALMAIPNLIAVLVLSSVVVSETKKYINDLDRRDDSEIPVVRS